MSDQNRNDAGINLIVWSDAGIPKVRAVPENHPERIEVGNRVFRPYFPEDFHYFWGALRGPGDIFVGFDVHIVDDPEIIRSPFASATRGVSVDPSPENPVSLIVLPGHAQTYNYESLEAFPVEFYSDGAGDFLLYFDDVDHWIGPWSGVGFDLEP